MDFDTFDETYSTKNDFPSIIMDMLRSINWKVAIFLYLLAVVIFSDLFIDIMISKKDIFGDTPNTRGTLIQITCLVMGYILIDLLVQGNCI